MSQLRAGFRFSQSSLATFQRCRRRFQLKYLRQLEWPAPVSASEEDWEVDLKRGQLFHQLVQQASMGIDVDGLVAACDDDLLRQWWSNFQRHGPRRQGRVYTEVELAVPLRSHLLVAKLDRVVVETTGRVSIMDWKTGLRPPSQQQLADSWQTAVYRFVTAEGGAWLTTGSELSPLPPEQIELLYWHAGFPSALEPIGYSAAEHEEVGRRLHAELDEIETEVASGAFSRTADVGQCRRCEYRSFCARGRRPESAADSGLWEEEDDADWMLIPPEER